MKEPLRLLSRFDRAETRFARFEPRGTRIRDDAARTLHKLRTDFGVLALGTLVGWLRGRDAKAGIS